MFFGPGDAPKVSASYVSGFKADSVGIEKDSKSIEINPERYFDIGLDFFPGLSNGFISGMTSVYRFTSSALGFDENAFKAVNLGADPDFVGGVKYGYQGGSGKSAAFVIHNVTSGSESAVPLPASAIGMLFVLVGVVGFRRSFLLG
jgi:hypothetical protein